MADIGSNQITSIINNESLKSVLELAPLSIYMTDTKGDCIFVNQHWIKRAGISLKHALGKGWLNAIHPEDRSTVADTWKEMINRQGFWDSEYRFINNLGEVNWVRGWATPLDILKGGFIGYLGINFDINENKKTQIALINSLSHIESIYQAADNVSFVTTDLGGYSTKILKFSRGAEIIFGYSADEAIGKNVSILHPPGDERNFPQMQEEIRKSQKGYRGITTLIRKSGEEFYADFTLHPHRDAKGKIIGTVGVTLDISKQKKDESRVIESERKLNTLLNNLQGMAYRCEYCPDWTMEYLSDGVKTLTGYTREDLIGNNKLSYNEIIITEDQDRVWHEVMEAVENNKSFDINYRIITKEGKTKYISEKGIGVRSDITDEVIALEGFITDITKLIESDEARIKVEELNRSIAQTAADAIISIDNQGIILVWNSAAEKIFGYSSEKMIGSNLSRIIPDQHRDNHYEGLKRLKDGFPEKLIGKTVELTALNKDKKEFPIELSLSSWQYGENKYFTAIIRNISERKFVENELINALSKAEESDRLKSSFLANMSHEIRTPMNGVLGFTDLLKQPDNTPEEISEYISVIEESGKRMLRTLNDILDISRIESKLLEVYFSEIQVEELILKICNFFRPEVEKKKLKLTSSIRKFDKDAIINSDYEKVYAVLTNILKNAIKYTNVGEIHISCVVSEKYCKISCKDTGIGIEKEHKERIFDRFVQADMSISRGYDGVGLGLSIAKAFIEILEGSIDIISELGTGTEFIVCIPRIHSKNRP